MIRAESSAAAALISGGPMGALTAKPEKGKNQPKAPPDEESAPPCAFAASQLIKRRGGPVGQQPFRKAYKEPPGASDLQLRGKGRTPKKVILRTAKAQRGEKGGQQTPPDEKTQRKRVFGWVHKGELRSKLKEENAIEGSSETAAEGKFTGQESGRITEQRFGETGERSVRGQAAEDLLNN